MSEATITSSADRRDVPVVPSASVTYVDSLTRPAVSVIRKQWGERGNG